MRKLFILSMLGWMISTSQVVVAQQNIGIGTTTPNASALLDVSSNNKGVLIPRLTKSQRNGIASPVKGLMVFIDDVDSVGFHFYDGGKWNWVQSNDVTDTIFWKRKGNAGTNPSVNFMGTTDNSLLNFRVNNIQAGRIDHLKSNTLFGIRAGNNLTTGFKNVFIGDSAGRANTSGNTNVYIGVNAGAALSDGIGNVFIGDSAGAKKTSTTGYSSVFIGDKAGSKTTSEPNTFVGNYAGRLNTTGFVNCFLGTLAGSENTTGDANTFLGEFTGWYNTTGSRNTFIGYYSGNGNTTGSQNTFIGFRTADVMATGNQNILLGHWATFGNPNLNNAVAIGTNARVDTSNGFVLGSINGINGATSTSLVGIGTTLPAARFHLANGDVVFTGPASLPGTPANTPVNGAGSRMMWYPDKAAFRVGLVDDDRWDKPSIGTFSVGMGYNSTASGFASMAVGQNIAEGNYSVALGYLNSVRGLLSVGIGYLNNAAGSQSISIGNANISSGDYSLALGFTSIANGNYSTATGLSTRSRAYASTAIGHYNDSIASSSPTNWIDTDPLFMIGNGTSGARKNAFMVLKNAKTGINNSSPQAMLHVTAIGSTGVTPHSDAVIVAEKDADDAYISVLTDSDQTSGIVFGNQRNSSDGGIYYNTGGNTYDLRFRTNGNGTRMTIDSIGNVGIGTTTPDYGLHIANTLGPDGFVRNIVVDATSSGTTGEASIAFKNAGTGGTGPKYWIVGLNQ